MLSVFFLSQRVYMLILCALGSHVGQPSSAYGWLGVFFPGFSGFRPPLMKDRLDISEIFLKGP